MRWWPFGRSGAAKTAPEPASPVFHALEYVECIRWQIAECPIAEGGVYQVSEVDENGGVHFNRCTRSHQARFFRPALVPADAKLDLSKHVQLAPGAVFADHACKLQHGYAYRVNDRDDFNRIRLGSYRGFYDGGCMGWHNPGLFTTVETQI